MVANDLRISQKMKNKDQFSIEKKDITKCKQRDFKLSVHSYERNY